MLNLQRYTYPFILAIAFCSLATSTVLAAEYRIVSLAPSSTEMLFALGAGEYVVGVDNFSNYPATANTLPKLGDFKGVSIEAIVALRPTHLALLENFLPEDSMLKLKRLGITPLLCNNRNIEDVKACAVLLGKALQRGPQGEAIAAHIEAARQRAQTAADLSRPTRVLLIVETEPLYAIGPRNYLHELFGNAGFENVLANSTTIYPMISFETLLASKPDALVTFRPKYKTDLMQFYDRANLKKRPPIVVLDEEVFTRSGPRVIEAYQALERLNAQLKK